MKKISKHFYLDEDVNTYLNLIQRKENLSLSEVINKTVKFYYDNLDKEEDIMAYVIKTIKKLNDNITSSQNLSKKNTDDLKEYIQQLHDEYIKDSCVATSNSELPLELSSIENDLLYYIASHPNLTEVGKSYTIPAIQSGEKIELPNKYQIECNIVIKSTKEVK